MCEAACAQHESTDQGIPRPPMPTLSPISEWKRPSDRTDSGTTGMYTRPTACTLDQRHGWHARSRGSIAKCRCTHCLYRGGPPATPLYAHTPCVSLHAEPSRAVREPATSHQPPISHTPNSAHVIAAACGGGGVVEGGVGAYVLLGCVTRCYLTARWEMT